ncbi:MAG: PKD domain-containing protein [Armatimonadetes bacterium]|nr:PKD domain-containing protein [Armatimonadota bacterium]
MKSKRTILVGFAALAVVTSIASVALAQAGVVSFPLFRGVQGSLDLGAWGSGNAQEVDKPVLVGTRAIRITTGGLYSGGRITFREPIDLSPALASPKTYLRIQTRFDTTQIGSVGAGGGRPPGVGGPPPGIMGGPPTGAGGRGGEEGGNFGGGGGGGFAGIQSAKFAASPFERMRYVITMADGTKYEMVRPVTLPPTEDPDSYVPIAFPVAAILKKGDGSTATIPTGDGAKLKEIAIFGDKYQQFLIGEIEVVTDDTDISVSPIEEPVVYTNDVIPFNGVAEAGTTSLRYSWDFDSSDGIQEDAVGRNVTHVFTSAGKRTVTLTVSDVDGIKQSDQKSVTFEVTGDK